VDFKTDRAEGEDLARYKRQVALYAAAISRATKQPVRAVLMQV
jgi:ATP-dependent exoDNAse (exonuclease V) beta subunit